MLLQYFGLQEQPFGATPDPRCLYPSHTHQEALASIKYGFQSNRGFTAMIAPPGMGKTTLLRRFLEDVRESTCIVFLFDIDAECQPREFVGYILREIGITPAKSSSEMHGQLSEALIEKTRAGLRFVVVIDEAQNLSDAVLERVRLLTNFETTRGKLMHVVLSGQPQLSDTLLKPSLMQLRQRVSTLCRIEPLSTEEIVAYIDYRLKQAGYKGEPLFTEDALRKIAEASQGIPRTINNLCFNALSLCYALSGLRVDGSMMDEVIADLQLIPKSREPIELVNNLAAQPLHQSKSRGQALGLLKNWIPAVASLLILCVLGIFVTAEYRASQSRKAGNEHSLDQSSLPESVHTSNVANSNESNSVETPRNLTTYEITVERDQRLQDLAMQYLGGFDLKRLHEIQRLNPRLTNPDHIEVGQKLRFPGPPPVSLRNDATAPRSQRSLP